MDLNTSVLAAAFAKDPVVSPIINTRCDEYIKQCKLGL